MVKLDIWLGLIALVASGLAGCSSHPDDSPPVGAEPGNTSSDSTTLRFLMSGCMGFAGSTLPYPRSVGPGQPPPGWEPDDPSIPVSYVTLDGFECSRISVGPFERGPLRIVWDGHDHADIPESCLANRARPGLASIINVFFVNDREVADYLRNEYGMPAEFADIEATVQSVGPVNQHSWSWSPDSMQSELTLLEEGTRAPFDYADRMFWQRSEGIGVLDMVYTGDVPEITSRVAYGSMQPPMLLAESPGGVFEAPLQHFSSLEGEGAFQFFSDALCEQAEPA